MLCRVFGHKFGHTVMSVGGSESRICRRCLRYVAPVSVGFEKSPAGKPEPATERPLIAHIKIAA